MLKRVAEMSQINDGYNDFNTERDGNFATYLPYEAIHPPELHIVKKAQYKFVDNITGASILNVKVTALKGLGFTVAANKGTFSLSESNKTYTAKATGYDSIQFKPVAGRTITVQMRKTPIKTAQYKFIDDATGDLIGGVTFTPLTDDIKNQMLRGLGAPTYQNGVFTFPISDFNEYFNVNASGYNPKNLFISDHSGVITVRLTQQKATVLFVDAATKKPVETVKVSTGLTGLFGLGAIYSNSNGLYTFSFKPNEYKQSFKIVAEGYQSKQVLITPSAGLQVIKLSKTPDVVKQPLVNSNNDTATRLRLAKAKAKARIRKIKLLAI